jgi:hypothetical protein
MKAPWPQDTDMPDTLVLGLTAHQLLLALPGVVLFSLGVVLTISHALPKWAGIAGVGLVAVMTAGLVLDTPDGMTWDRWLAALLRFRRGPRVEAIGGDVAPLPSWVRAGGGQAGRLVLPWGTPDVGGVPLGKDKARGRLGHALALALSPLDHVGLDGEDLRLVVGALSAWLTALDCHAQVLVRSRSLDLTDRIAHLGVLGEEIGDPALRAVAARREEELRRVAVLRPRHLQAWVVLRCPDREALADRARRCAEVLAGAGVEAVPVPPAGMAQLLGGSALGDARSPAGWPGPDEVERVDHETLRVGERYVQTLRAVTWPPSVEPGWLMPVLRADVDLDLAMHISPEAPDVAVGILRSQFGRMRSTQQAQSEGGDLADAKVKGAANDAGRLHDAVGANETRTFRVGCYLSVWADDLDELEKAAAEASAKARGVMLDLRPVVFAPVEAWVATQPVALDLVRHTWRADTEAVATGLPVWTGEAESDPGGALEGFHLVTGAPQFIDRFALGGRRANAHKVSVAASGRGKSFAIKTEVIGLRLEGVAVRILDLEGEYVRLATALGGTVVRPGAGGVCVNTFDLAEAGQVEALSRQATFVESFVTTLLGELTSREQAQLARAVMACYALAGITANPETHGRTPPTLADLHAALVDDGAQQLAERLETWTLGGYAGLLSGATSVRPEGDLVVWALGDLPAENERLVAAVALLVVHAVWTEIARQDHRRRVVVLDEAWHISETSAAAGRVLEGLARRLAKGARKYQAGLTAATQDLEDFEATALGRAILNNSAIKWLPGQEDKAIDGVAKAFGLSASERRFLLGCKRGEGLLLAGRQRVRIRVEVTPEEHRLATSDPDELARIDAEEVHSAAESAVARWARCVAGLDADLAAAVTGPELAALTARVLPKAPLTCSWEVVDATGDWMAGQASADAQLAWRDGERSWGELVHLELVRRGRCWLVAKTTRSEVSA